MAVTPARAAIAQRTQLVLETTYGAVPATPAWYRLPNLAIKPRPNVEAVAHREQGRKFSSVVIPNREWSSATFEGPLSYSELPFIYCSLFGLPSGYPFTAGTDGEVTYTMQPANDTPDTPASFSLQHGDNSANGIQMGGVIVTDATLEITRAAATLSGTMLGQKWATGQTLAVSGTPVGATVTDVENIPVTPGSLSVYLDTTFAGIGTTKLTKFLSLRHAVTGRWQPEWVVDASQPSFLTMVEGAPSSTLTLRMEADAVAMGLMATYRLGSIRYLRLTTGGTVAGVGGNGPLIAGTHNYNMILDVPVEIKNLLEYTDEGGVYAFGVEMEPISDNSSGGAAFPMRLITTSKQTVI